MTGWLATPWPATLLALLGGLLLGRVLNRCIQQFPRHESLADQLRAVWDRTPSERILSAARGIGHRLPVVGWFLPGHPLRPSRRRAARLALVELANGLLCAAVAWVELPHGFVSGPPDPFAIPGSEFLAADAGALGLQLLRLFAHLVLVQALVVATVIDLDTMTIPDGSTVPAMAFAVLLSLCGGLWLVPVWYEDGGIAATFGMSDQFFEGVLVPGWIAAHPLLHGLAASLCGLVVGGGTVWAVRVIGHWALRREAMGFGDVVLMAMIGAFVGWQPVLVVFFLAPVCALVVIAFMLLTGGGREFPYGPWLSLATVVVLLGWQWVWPTAGAFFLMGRLIPIVAAVVLVLLAVLLWAMRVVRGEAVFEESPVAWGSADQLHYQSQENPPRANTWRAMIEPQWPGVEAARGTQGEVRWRGNDQPPHWRR